MKQKISLTTIALTMLLLYPCFTKAQFLKKILNDVKQTTQNRADDKADQATDNAIDGITKSKPKDNSSNVDTAAIGGVLGAFAKAAQDNPNDTSMGDLIGKSLGNLTGGGGVSAADSAAAIKTFMNADGGSGIYYEYTVQATTERTGSSTSISKIYFTNNGEGRSEINIAAMMGAKNASAMVNIARANEPQYSVTLDDAEKSYSLNVIDTSLINNHFSKDKVTKIGNETVNGYNCIHSKITSVTGSGMFKSTTTEDIWTSTDVPGYSIMKKAMLQNVTPQMVQALNDAGCGGFFVKMVSGDKDYTMTMQLTKAEKQSFAASLFKIPSGYTESKGSLMFGNMMKAAASQKQ